MDETFAVDGVEYRLKTYNGFDIVGPYEVYKVTNWPKHLGQYVLAGLRGGVSAVVHEQITLKRFKLRRDAVAALKAFNEHRKAVA